MALYSTATDSIKVFWDWRHRLITMLLAVVSALGIASAAIGHAAKSDDFFASVPLFVAALFSLSVAPLTVRTEKIIRNGIQRAKGLEDLLAPDHDTGFFGGWTTDDGTVKKTPWYGFGRVLPVMSGLLAAGLAAFGGWLLWCYANAPK